MNVTGANDPTGVNIHKGIAGQDGEIVVDLMKVSKHSDTPKGMIMRGNVTESSLTGSMAGKTIDDLKTAIASGDVYINLKTEDHPDGLMRGQIKLKGGDNATDSSATDSSATDSTNQYLLEEEENAPFLFYCLCRNTVCQGFRFLKVDALNHIMKYDALKF